MRTMTAEEMKARGRERLIYWCDHLKRMVSLNAPSAVIAHATFCLFLCAFGHHTKHMAEEFARFMAAKGRDYVGKCQNCDAEQAVGCRDGLCEACHAKSVAWVLKMEAEMEGMDGPAAG